MSKFDLHPRRDVGFRFLPTDEELVVNYLLSKLIGVPPPSDDYVNDCDLYGDLEPWEIWHKFRGLGCEEEEEADNDLYFVTPFKKRTATGLRIDRSVGSNGGTWHGEDSGKEAQTPDGLVSWTLKRFSYRPKKSKGEKNGLGPTTSWIMHEYCLLDRPIPFLGLDSAAATRLAVCRIRKKQDSNSKKRKNDKGPKVIFIDLEDDDYNGVVEVESSIIDNKRQKVDTTPFQAETESCLSEVKEGCGGGNPDEGAVASYVAELERCLSEVNEECGGGNVNGGEGAVASFEGCLSEVREDCGGDNGGHEGELEEALFDAEIEDCLAEVEEEEEGCSGGDGDEEEDDGSWLEAEIEGCMSEEELAASTTSDFEALIQQYFSAGAAPGVVTSSAVAVPSY
ncbi:unnamed protein product [Linum tenue]|uniref:NAC domain-containing protein n=1 Tax=Linum tenue TaxID=586396 RepID=A0AAV0RZ10_9ROSI|nr:unnamed protein product [Linum tenue]